MEIVSAVIDLGYTTRMATCLPRAKIGLSFKELIYFLLRLFLKKATPDMEERHVSSFETEFANLFSMPQGVVFPKARVGFYYLLKEMNLEPGGEVIISDINIADFANIILCAGFRPVVVDVDKATYCIDYDDLERKITKKTVLFMVTYLSGFVPDMERISEISVRRGVPFIEDCSQALSSTFGGRLLGSFGDAAIYSLSLLKPVSTMFGGMVLTKNTELLKRLKARQNSLTPSHITPLFQEAIKNIVIKLATSRIIFSYLVFHLIRASTGTIDFFSRFQRSNRTVTIRYSLPEGLLVRFSWQQALMGLKQLESVRAREHRRIENGKILYSEIHNRPQLKKPGIIPGCENAFWLFPVYVDAPSLFKKHLARYQVDSAGYLLSVLSQEEAFQGLGFSTRMAAEIKRNTVFIPMYAELERHHVHQIVSAVSSYGEQQG